MSLSIGGTYQVMLDLSNIISITVHLINSRLEQQLFNYDTAQTVCTWIMRHQLDTRCLWMCQVNASLNVVDREASLRNIGLSDEMVEYIAYYFEDIFLRIEHIISQILDGHVPSLTWCIWGLETKQYGVVVLINQGDYRIEEWAKFQEANHTPVARYYNYSELREQ